MPGAGRYGGVTVPALPVRFVAGSAVGFPDVSIVRRIAGIAGSGRRTGNRLRLRGRSGVPWGAARVLDCRWCDLAGTVPWGAVQAASRARYRPGRGPSGGYCSASCS